MAKCGHYDNWRRDFELIKVLGIEYLRYGPPVLQAHHGAPDKYDWSFADETFNALNEMDIEPDRRSLPFWCPGLGRRIQQPRLASAVCGLCGSIRQTFPVGPPVHPGQ